MIKGLFRSASGMLPAIKKQETIANNVANAKTAGYKKDAVFSKELSRSEKRLAPKQSDWQTPMVNDIFTDFSAGTFTRTDNPLDMAIDGDGFFQVELEDGRIGLTRSGSFSVNRDGLLAHSDGPVLLTEGGAIEPGNGKLSVSASGQVDVNGAVIAQITPVTVDDLQALEKIGNSLYVVPEGTPLTPVQPAAVRQGYLEQSNVDIVRQMIDMIVAYRTYEANARAVSSQDSSLEHLFNRVGGNS